MKRAKRYAFIHKVRYWTEIVSVILNTAGSGWAAGPEGGQNGFNNRDQGSSFILAALLDQKVQLTDSRVIQADLRMEDLSGIYFERTDQRE